jgi:hypothetical protein
MKRRSKPRARSAGLQTARDRRISALLSELDRIACGAVQQPDPIQEKLRACPEAFQAGELIQKLFDTLQYRQEELGNERYLPPAGAVIPPLV